MDTNALMPLVNVACTFVFSLLAYFAKSKMDAFNAEMKQLGMDVKQIRDDIFTASIANETHKANCQNIFAKQDSILRIWDHLDDMKIKIAKIESEPYGNRRFFDPKETR